MNGVIILCKDKPQYACAAYNLALSIKYHTPDIHITLLSDSIHEGVFQLPHYTPFNLIKHISELGIANAKLSISDYAFADNNLYIDADSICLKDISPLFDKLKGCNFRSNVIEGYTQWTSPENFVKHFKTEPSKTINSSWIYFEDKRVFAQAKQYLDKGFPIADLNEKWGGVLPDEMFFNAALSKLKIDAKIDFDLMFFDEKKGNPSPTEIAEKYYFITYYGNRNNTALYLQDYYDRAMFAICTKFGIEHKFKLHAIMTSKLVNDK